MAGTKIFACMVFTIPQRRSSLNGNNLGDGKQTCCYNSDLADDGSQKGRHPHNQRLLEHDGVKLLSWGVLSLDLMRSHINCTGP